MVCLLKKYYKSELEEYKDIVGSEEAAYYLLSENNGYTLDLDPNGNPSQLYKDLLNKYNGDKKRAIFEKSKYYTPSYYEKYGNWAQNFNSEPHLDQSVSDLQANINYHFREFLNRVGIKIEELPGLAENTLSLAEKILYVNNAEDIQDVYSVMAKIGWNLLDAFQQNAIRKLYGKNLQFGKEENIIEDIAGYIEKHINDEIIETEDIPTTLQEDTSEYTIKEKLEFLYRQILKKIKTILSNIIDNKKLYNEAVENLSKKILNKSDDYFSKIIKDGFELKTLSLDDIHSTPIGKVYDILTSDKYKGGLNGSCAVRLQGTLYRKKEEDFHDLDFTMPYNNFSWTLRQILQPKYLLDHGGDKFLNGNLNRLKWMSNAEFKEYRTFVNKLALEEFQKTELYKDLKEQFEDVGVKALFISKGMCFTITCDGFPVDLFYGKFPNVKEIKGIRISDFTIAFEAKLRMRRPKDMRDIINFSRYTNVEERELHTEKRETISDIERNRDQFVQNEFNKIKNIKDKTIQQLNKIKNIAISKFNNQKQKSILDDTNKILINAFGLQETVDENGNKIYVSKKTTDGKYDLIVEFVSQLSDETGESEGWYDYNAKSAIAHHVIKIALDGIDPSTLNHELAHHYVKMFWGSPVIQDALGAVYKKGMTQDELEEALVDVITSRVQLLLTDDVSRLFTHNFWNNFQEMIQQAFGRLTKNQRQVLLDNATKAFSINENQNLVNDVHQFEMSENRMYKKKSKKETKLLEKISKAREQARINRKQNPYQVVNKNSKLQNLMDVVVRGAITRRNILERHGSVSEEQVVKMNMQEERVRDAVNKINEERNKALSAITSSGTISGFFKNRAKIISSSKTKEEYEISAKLLIQVLREGISDIGDYIQMLENAQTYRFAKIVYQNQKDDDKAISRKYIPNGAIVGDFSEEDLDFDKMQTIGKESVSYYKGISAKLSEFLSDPGITTMLDEDTINLLQGENDNLNSKAEILSNLYEEGRKQQIRTWLKNILYKTNEHTGKLEVNPVLNMSVSDSYAFYDECCRWLFNSGIDVHKFYERYLGVKEFSKSPVVRLLHSAIFNEMQTVRRENEKIASEGRVLKEKAKKALIRKGKLLTPFRTFDKMFLELDENGIPTGNILGKINRHKFNKARQEFMNEVFYGSGFSYIKLDGTLVVYDSIEKQCRDILGDDSYELEINDDGSPLLPDDSEQFQDVLKCYEIAKNEFLCENTNRQFVPQYYRQKLEILSAKALKAERDAKKEINNILKLCKIDGVTHTELLSPSQMNALKRAYQAQSLLSNPYDKYGRKKLPGTNEYQIYQELSQWHEYTEGIKYKLDEESFNNAQDNSQDKDQFRRLNTYRRISQDFWDAFQDYFGKNDDEELNNLLQERRQLISVVKDSGLVQPRFDQMWDEDNREIRPEYIEFFKELKRLDIAIEKRKEIVYKKDSRSKEVKNWIKRKDRLWDRIEENGKTKDISWYDHMCDCIVQKHKDSGAADWYSKAQSEINLISFSINRREKPKPLSIFNYTIPKSKKKVYKGVEIETTYDSPIRVYSTLDYEETNDTFINFLYDNNSDEYAQPNYKYWNEKYEDLLYQPQEVLDYYKWINDTMKKSFEKIPFIGNYNQLAPQIGMNNSSAFSRYGLKLNPLKAFTGIGKAIVYTVKRIFGINEEDEELLTTKHHVRTDGTIAKRIPVRYIKRLDDSSELSANLLGSVIAFHEMATAYQSRKKLSGVCVAIYEQIHSVQSNSDHLKILKHLIDSNIYGMTVTGIDDYYESGWKQKMYQFYKRSGVMKTMARVGLLGGNVTSGSVAALDAFFSILRDVFVGRNAGRRDLRKAFKQLVINLPNQMLQMGSLKQNYTGSTAAYMNFFGLTENASERFKTADRNRFRRMFGVQKILMSPFQFADYNANAIYMEEVLNNIRYDYYTKQFLTQEEYMQSMVNNGYGPREAYRTYINSPSIRDCMHINKYGYPEPRDNENGELLSLRDEEFRNAVYNKVASRVKSRASYYNGVVEGTQSTNIQSNPWTGWIAMVRNFMLIMAAHKFGTNDDFFIYGDEDSEAVEVDEDLLDDDDMWGQDTNDKTKIERTQHHRKGYYNFMMNYKYSPEVQATYNAMFRQYDPQKNHNILKRFGHNMHNLIGYYFYQMMKHKSIHSRTLSPFSDDLYQKATKQDKEYRKRKQLSDTEISSMNYVFTSIMFITMLTAASAVFHNSFVDDYDDELWFQIVDIVLLRLPIEIASGFSWMTVLELIKSVTAGQSVLDNITVLALLQDVWYALTDNPKLYESQKGVYQGESKLFKDVINNLSIIGAKNIYKQTNVNALKQTKKFYTNMELYPFYPSTVFWKDNKRGMFYDGLGGEGMLDIQVPEIDVPEIDIPTVDTPNI